MTSRIQADVIAQTKDLFQMLASKRTPPSTTHETDIIMKSPSVIVKKNPVPKDPFNESIYDLLPVEIHLPEKPPQYKSIFSGMVRTEVQMARKGNGSIGPAKVAVPPPVEFLRRGEGAVKYKVGKNCFYLFKNEINLA